MSAPNQNLFGNMKAYSPLKMDEDDDDIFSHKVGDLLDISGKPAQTQQPQGSQGASSGLDFDPFAAQPAAQQNQMAMAASNPASGGLFDEDDILGVISTNDPIAAAAKQ